MARLRALLAGLTAGLAIWASTVYVRLPAERWVPDLAVGGAAAAFAATTWRSSRPVSSLGLALAGTWWAGTAWSPALYWHRGVLVHLVLSAPLAWPRSRVAVVTVVAGYAVSLISPAWQAGAIALGVAALVLSAAISRAVSRRQPRHLLAPVLFVGAVVLGAVAPALTTGPDGQAEVTIAYDALLLVAIGALAWSTQVPDRAQLTDLAVDLGAGRALDVATLTEQVRLEPGLDTNRELQAALDVARRLETANRQVRDRLRSALDDVGASRRRLVVAAAAERARLGAELDDGVVAPLRLLAADAVPPVSTGLLRAQEALAASMAGLRPPGLDEGLAQALRTHPLVRSTECALVLASARCEDVVEDTLYSVASEALTNVAKHAGPSRVTVRFEVTEDQASLSVTDDGTGGASPRAGSGLAELADRLEALQGSLTVQSTAGEGTTVTASVPRGQTGVGPRPRSEGDTPTEP